MKMRQFLWGAGLAAGLLAGCGGDAPVGPVAGELTLSLVTPGNSDGAVLIRVTGPIESVTAMAGYRVESSAVPGGMWRIVVAGNVTGGPVARIRVPDINAAAEYLAIVEQVAARGTFALLSTSGYGVQVER